ARLAARSSPPPHDGAVLAHRPDVGGVEAVQSVKIVVRHAQVLRGLHPGAVARAVMGDAAQEPDAPDIAAAGAPDVVEIVGAVVAPGRAVEVHAIPRIAAGPQIVRAAAPD